MTRETLPSFETDEPIRPFASPEVWDSMTPEQKRRAYTVRSAIAEGPLGWSTDVTEETLRVVKTEQGGESHFSLVHTGAGVDMGDPDKPWDTARSYYSVMSGDNDSFFQVEVDGVTYDCRRGITEAVYFAKVDVARELAITLPDSRQAAEQSDNAYLMTCTMLTGEELDQFGAVKICSVRDSGDVYSRVADPESGSNVFRVCPAIDIT